MPMLKFLMPICLSIAPPLAALAQAAPPTVRAGDMLVGTVGIGDLQLLLEDMGARFTLSGVSDRGAPYVFAVSKEGMSFGIFTACASPDGTDCRGVEFLAVFESGRPADVVTAIDQSYAAISVYKPDPETVHVSRYVILDHGVTWANLLENAAVFEVLCEHVAEELSETGPETADDGSG